MNKLLSFFLIFIFLCANTSIGQLLKVPNLINHYQQHKMELATNAVSFSDYLFSHYSNKTGSSKEHKDLPFKTFDTSVIVLFTNSPFSYQISVVKQLIASCEKFFYNETFTSNLIISIWLPPKIAC